MKNNDFMGLVGLFIIMCEFVYLALFAILYYDLVIVLESTKGLEQAQNNLNKFLKLEL